MHPPSTPLGTHVPEPNVPVHVERESGHLPRDTIEHNRFEAPMAEKPSPKPASAKPAPIVKPPRPELVTAPFVVMIAITFFNGLYYKGMDAGIPLHYDDLGMAATVGGTFVAVYTIASTVTRLFAGQLSDDHDHVQVLLGGLGLLLLGALIPALWPEYAVVLVCRVLQGVGFSIATNAITVICLGLSPKKKIGQTVGLKGAGSSLATMLGALLATVLLTMVGYQGFFWFYVALMAVGMVAAVLAARSRRMQAQRDYHRQEIAKRRAAEKAAEASGHGENAFQRWLRSFWLPGAFPYALIEFARRCPKGICITFVLIYAKHLGLGTGAYFFVIAGVFTLLGRLLGGKLYNNARPWLLVPMVGVGAVGFLPLMFCPTVWALGVAGAFYGITIGTSSPLLKTLTAKAVSKEHWGVANSELYFLGDLGLALGAYGGGILVDALGKAALPAITFWTGVAATALTAVVLVWAKRRKGVQAA